MDWRWLLPIVIVSGLAVCYLLARFMRVFGSQVHVERAREAFRLQRERLEMLFFQAAGSTGKPRGLVWVECQWESGALFARDRQSGQIAALVAVTIRFEAVIGSDMEDLPAVGNLRNASAVFFFH